MIQGTFEIGNTRSHEINSFIQFLPEISAPRRKVQRRQISGVSEDYIFDEEAYENTPITLELFARIQPGDDMQRLKERITSAFMGGRYLDFVPYWDSQRIYQVEVLDPPNFVSHDNHSTTIFYTVGLSAKPFKSDRNKVVQESTKSLSLINPYGYGNRPVITLYGTGNMTLVVNGNEYVFKGVDGHIVVDSRIESAYKIISGQPKGRDDRMYTMEFPLLKKSENKIATKGNATRFRVETRWRTLVS